MNDAIPKSQESKEDKQRFWRAHQLAWEASGLNRTAYCRREGLKLSSFDYQRACLRAADAAQVNLQATTSPVVPVKQSLLSARTNRTHFVPATRPAIATPNNTSTAFVRTADTIHLQSPAGWQIELSLHQMTHHPGTVQSLLRWLEASP